MSVTFKVDKKSYDKTIKTLRSLPRNVQRNAMNSALTAGANVIKARARAKAPSCLRSSIIVKRRRKRSGKMAVSIVAGRGRSRTDDLTRILDERVAANPASGSFTGKAKKIIESAQCPPAFWVEFGTYGNRDLQKDPYTADTLKKKRYVNGKFVGTYASNGGKSPSYYWNDSSKWTKAQPFLRPAMISSFRDDSVTDAMVIKLDEYFRKKGIT